MEATAKAQATNVFFILQFGFMHIFGQSTQPFLRFRHKKNNWLQNYSKNSE